MERLDIQRLRDLPIEEVAQRLGLEVSRHKTLCPFHPDKHPSLTFDTSRNRYRCWSCGAHGDVIDLAMKVRHFGFAEACRWLSPYEGQQTTDNRLRSKVIGERNVTNEAGNNSSLLYIAQPRQARIARASPEPNSSFDVWRYARFFEHPYISPEACHLLFDERKLDPRVISWCRLNSYTDKQGIHWLQIPYYDPQGQLIGVQARNLTPSQPPRGEENKDSICCSESGASSSGVNTPLPSGRTGGGQPRFRFWSGARVSIYNLPVLNRLRPGDELYIAEGSSDCWALLSAGHKAIAIPSATLLKPEDLRLLDTLIPDGVTLHMYPDQDAPGCRLYLQLKDHWPQLIYHQLPEGCKDFSDYYRKSPSQSPP